MAERVCANCGGVVDSVSSVCENCATQAVSRAAIPPAAGDLPEISGYRLLSQLGEGGMGTVYLAEETALGRRVAIKIVASRVVNDAGSKLRFAREARTLATIEHPHVVRVYSYGEAGGQPYLAMEFVEGETLGERLNRSGRLPVDESLRIARQVIEALEAAWEQRVVHRDIKPSNVLIDRRGRVRVADFGLAKPIEVAGSPSPEFSLTEAGLVVGTPHYLAPEQAQGRPTDHRSDIYSVGLLLYQMLTGERPFDASSPFEVIAKQLREPLPSLREKRPDVPEGVAALVHSMTHKEPERRPQRHREILEKIETLIGTTPTSDTKTMTVPATGAYRMIGWWQSFAIIGATVLAVWAVSWFAMMKEKKGPAAGPPPRVSSFVVAVAPFYGPDSDSVKEGRVMAALVERAIGERLGSAARVLGIEETKEPVRSSEQARALGERLGASAVIWGEAFALRAETEIQPHVTVIAPDRPATQESASPASSTSPVTVEDALSGRGTASVKLQATAPNQIELRKMSAAGVGDIVVLLAAIHRLEREKNARAALKLLRELPRTTQTMRYEVRALVEERDHEAARKVLEEILAADPMDVQSWALLGDLHVMNGAFDRAAAAFRAAEAAGKPFTSARAVLFEGQLYVKETFRSLFTGGEEERDTGSILIVDPETGVVQTRFELGAASAFRVRDGKLEITYTSRENTPPRTVRFRSGRPDQELALPVNYAWRLGQWRSGSVIPSNFAEQVTGVRDYGEPGGEFKLTEVRYEGLPETLPELEQALRLAMQKDPTQPWHLLWLAVTLDHQKRPAEANAVIDDLARREFPGTPYYVYSQMANQFERMQKPQWADRMLERAAAKRRLLAQPPTFTTLIERLVNAAPRQAALNRRVERGYTVLQKSREISGVAIEGDDIVAMLWARHFEEKGDLQRARSERELVQRIFSTPLSVTRRAAAVRYAAFAFVAAVAAVLLHLLVVFSTTLWRAYSRPHDQEKFRMTRREWRTWVIVATLASAALAYGAVYAIFVAGAAEPLYGIGVIAAIAAVLFLAKVSPRRLLASVPRGARRMLWTGYAVLVGSAFLLVLQVHRSSGAAGMPIGLADAQGNPEIVGMFDEALTTRPGDATRYAAAVVNHWARDWKRAEDLYEALPPGYEGAKANLEAVRLRRPPSVLLTESDVYRAFEAPLDFGTIRRLPQLLRWYSINVGAEASVAVVAGAVFGVPPLLFILLFMVPVAEDGRPAGPSSRIPGLFIPAFDSAAGGRQVRAFLEALSFGFAATGIALLAGFFLNPQSGWIHDLDWNFAVPFPTPNGFAISLGDRLSLLFAPPESLIWWSIVGVAFVAFAALHASTVVRVLREGRVNAAPAAPEPAAV